MSNLTIHQLTELAAAPATDDEIGLWDLSVGQYKRIRVSNLHANVALLDGANTFTAQNIFNGNVGIRVTPTATLHVARGTAASGTAVFAGTTYPSIFNAGTEESTFVTGGKAGALVAINDAHNGEIWLAGGGGSVFVLSNRLSVGGQEPEASLDVMRGVLAGGTARLRGTTHTSIFNDATAEDTYIRGGKNLAKVYINDAVGTGDVLIAGGGGKVGIGVASTIYMLDVARGSAADGTIRIQGTSYHSVFNNSTAEDTFIRGGKAGAKVYINDSVNGDVRIAEGGGNVGIGVTPTTKLHIKTTIATGRDDVLIESPIPDLTFYDTSSTTDNRYWDIAVINGALMMRAVNDANNSAQNFLEVNRAGATIDNVAVPNGDFSVGTVNPLGKFHVHDGVGGAMFVTKTNIDGTPVTLIPNGTGDVLSRVAVWGVSQASSGVTQTIDAPSGGALGDAPALFDDGTNVLQMDINLDGSVQVRRVLGSLTYNIALWMIWR